MKRTVYSLLILLMILSCDNKQEENAPAVPRIINPGINEGENDLSYEGDNEVEENSFLVPMVEISPDEHIQKLQDVNLDQDIEEEQIIITMFRDENDDEKLKIYIADYNNDRMRYQISLEEEISPDHLEGLSIHQQDLNGNNLNEVLVTGFNKRGFQTLDVFSIRTQGGASGLTYSRIARLVINGTIEIQTAVRSQEYQSGQITWESFPIITEETNPEEDENLDLIKTVYNWNRAARRYEPVSIAKIPGATIKEENLKELYRGDLDDFKSFLSGPWHRVSDSNGEKQPFLQDMLYFQPDEEQVIFTIDDVQEIYDWDETYRTIFKGILIQSRNILINSLRRDIYITVEDMDSIRLKIQGTTEWGGYYEPLNLSLQQGLINDDSLEPIDELNRLNGLFKGGRGTEFYLDYPHFTERTPDGENRQGVYTFFNLYGTGILQIRYQRANGLLDERAVYKAEFSTAEDSSRIIRTLSLEPGTLTVSGFIQSPGDNIQIEQIEVIDES
ncbi:MAG: pallilysin-related adhesin [Spirochaetales bacterium]|nr:pallilysin-related adhesin [Spirochaetales bacterium]